MTHLNMRHTIVAAIVSATAIGAVTPAWPAPVMTSSALVADTASPLLTDVRYNRRRGYRRDNGAAVALGIFGAVGAVAAASAYRRNGYYGGGPGYGYGYGGGYGGGGYPGYYGRPYGGPSGYGYYGGRY